jgi:hypothetical protein
MDGHLGGLVCLRAGGGLAAMAAGLPLPQQLEHPEHRCRFGAGLAALAAFVEREGHVRVPRTHKEGGVSLGSWLNNQKARRDKLTPEQLGQLETLGVAW